MTPPIIFHQPDKVTSVAFTPDGTRFATVTSDGTVRVWHCLECGSFDWCSSSLGAAWFATSPPTNDASTSIRAHEPAHDGQQTPAGSTRRLRDPHRMTTASSSTERNGSIGSTGRWIAGSTSPPSTWPPKRSPSTPTTCRCSTRRSSPLLEPRHEPGARGPRFPRLEERSGAADPALQEDVAALRAQLTKDRALEATGAERTRRAADAAELYEAIYRRLHRSYTCINAATMWLLAGDEPRAIELARQAQMLCHEIEPRTDDDRYWQATTEAEAALLLGDQVGFARRWLEQPSTDATSSRRWRRHASSCCWSANTEVSTPRCWNPSRSRW